MTTVFLYGTLCHLPLLAEVLGYQPQVAKAELTDHKVVWAKGQDFPLILKAEGCSAFGIMIEVDATARARLDFYEGPFGYHLTPVEVQTDGDVHQAETYFPDAGLWAEGAPWSLRDWADAHGALATHAAKETMEHMGRASMEQMAHLTPMIRARAHAEMQTATWQRPRSVGTRIGAEKVEILDRTPSYRGFFSLDDIKMRHPRFDGGPPLTVDRAVFRIGEAATVLPYDPVRDCVLMLEQFRPAPFIHGDPDPWLLEPVAGLCDAGEGPEDTARREAQEEAGIQIEELFLVARHYPSPGATAQVHWSYLGIADLPETTAKTGGLIDEGEDIAIHIIPFADAMAMMESGELVVAPLIMSLQYLAQKREKLRKLA